MEGVFIKKKSTLIWQIIGLICGIYLLILFVHLWITDPPINLDEYFILVFFIVLSIIDIVVFSLSFLYNYHVFILIKDSHISARYGLNRKLECDCTEISFVDWQPNILTIVLDNGKRINILNLDNSHEICVFIRRKLKQNKFDKEKIKFKLLDMQNKRKNEIHYFVFIFITMVFALFAFLIITDWKDLSDLNKYELILAVVIGIIELVLMTVMLVVANSCGKKLPVINNLKYQLRDLTLKTSKLPVGNPVAVYMDSDSYERCVVLGIPNSKEVYYVIEALNNEYELENVETSEIFKNISELPFYGTAYIDISKKFGL